MKKIVRVPRKKKKNKRNQWNEFRLNSLVPSTDLNRSGGFPAYFQPNLTDK